MSYAEPLQTEPAFAKNGFILEWWTPAHDRLLLDTIKKQHWVWYWSITDRICNITAPSTVDRWKEADPLCKRYAWGNILMYFAAARAKQLGYYSRIRRPRSRKCPVCRKTFKEDSVPPSIVGHLGIDQIDICFQCIRDGFYRDAGSNRLGRPGIIRWIRDAANDLGVIPRQDPFDSVASLSGLSTTDRAVLVGLAKRRPSVARVKNLFGSWLAALVQADILEGGVRETDRGTQALARDGHVCLSLGEKTIDDYLFKLAIPHSKEPRYPDSNFRADFEVGTYFIEYFGLAGDREYDRKSDEKRLVAERHSINLIELFPRDLMTDKRLATKLAPAIRSLDASSLE